MQNKSEEFFMLNIIWISMLTIGLTVGIINGNISEVTKAGFDAAGDAVMFCIGLMGIMCLWCGFIKITEKAGLSEILAKIFRPFIRKLFPDISDDDTTVSAIMMNISANMMGLGNAATPLGINACKEIKRTESQKYGNSVKYKLSKNICLFVIINSVSIQLIPSTVIAMRAAAGSQSPSDILIPIWIVSISIFIIGITISKICEKFLW